jgi:hypothetical protein
MLGRHNSGAEIQKYAIQRGSIVKVTVAKGIDRLSGGFVMRAENAEMNIQATLRVRQPGAQHQGQ